MKNLLQTRIGRMLFVRANKIDIINFLGKSRSYRTYLEICTPTSGRHFPDVDRSVFFACHRLMYNSPLSYADGWNIDFRSETLEIAQCVELIRAGGNLYDVILVDPWHQYETSYRDIQVAMSLLAENGTIIIHDCLPPTKKMASPDFLRGNWCGLTYKAYLDFVLQFENTSYITVDTDYGCGLIRKAAQSDVLSDERQTYSNSELIFQQWFALNAAGDLQALYDYFYLHRHVLLNLVKLETFKRIEAQGHAKGDHEAGAVKTAPAHRWK